MKVAMTCRFDGTLTQVEVPVDEWRAWMAGTLIQDATPSLSVIERETLMTGMCASCQERVFGDDQ